MLTLGRVNPYTLADVEKSKCAEEMKRFQEITKITLKPGESFKWEHVVETMSAAATQNKGDKGLTSAISSFTEQMGDNGPAIEQWLQLLPSGEYTSVICGAFKLILTAAIRKSQLRQTIFQAIASTPTTLRNAKRTSCSTIQKTIIHVRSFARCPFKISYRGTFGLYLHVPISLARTIKEEESYEGSKGECQSFLATEKLWEGY